MVQTISKCPMAAGNVVFRARALYALIKPNIKYNDKEICGLAGINLRKQKETFYKPNAQIYPNPISERATLVYDFNCEDIGSFRIINSFGQLIFLHNLTAGKAQFEFSTSDFAPGIFHCLINCNASTVANLKLVIIR